MRTPATRLLAALALATSAASVSGCSASARQVAALPTAAHTPTPSSSPTPTPTPTRGVARLPTPTPLPPAPPPPALPLAGRVVVLDPGHNGQNWAHPEVINALVDAVTLRKPCDTTGSATDSGYPESAFTFDVATRVRDLLLRRGARVVLTRPDNAGVGPCITQRAAIGNAAHADVAISIHGDGGPATGRGFHVIAPAAVGPNNAMVASSLRFAELLRSVFRAEADEPFASYTAAGGLTVRSDLGGLNLSVVPKVFLECANLRNATDAARVLDPAWRQQAAVAIADAVSSFLRAGNG